MAILCGVVFGTAIGALPGWLVAAMKLPPFTLTLGMRQIVLAAHFLYSASETLRSQEIGANAPLLQFLFATFKIGTDEDGRGGATFTDAVVFMVLVVASLAYDLRHTAWGRYV